MDCMSYVEEGYMEFEEKEHTRWDKSRETESLGLTKRSARARAVDAPMEALDNNG